MKTKPQKLSGSIGSRTTGRSSGGASTVLLLLVGALTLAGVISWFLIRSKASRESAPAETPVVELQSQELSSATLATLREISAPVELRYYALLDQPAVSEVTKSFAQRVEALVSLYEQEANGKLQVVKFAEPTPEARQSARADGISPFAAGEREAAYLGIAVVRGNSKVVLSKLTPDWEQALEPDITRAIAEVQKSQSQAMPEFAESVKKQQSEAAAQVRETLPNLDSMSLQEAREALRAAALKDFQVVARELQQAVKDAEAAVTRAQASGTDTDREKALLELKEARQRQAEKLQEISARLQAQATALEQIKK